eukprot:3407736-Rhodomonas_salina.1
MQRGLTSVVFKFQQALSRFSTRVGTYQASDASVGTLSWCKVENGSKQLEIYNCALVGIPTR